MLAVDDVKVYLPGVTRPGFFYVLGVILSMISWQYWKTGDFSVSGCLHESISSPIDKNSGGDCFGGSVDNLSDRQLLAVAEATIIQPLVTKEVTVVAASESSTRTIDTEGE